MESLPLIIVLGALLVIFTYFLGLFLGVADCKRRFKIPDRATGVDEDGEYIY